MTQVSKIALWLACGALLAACAEKEVILQGERLSPNTLSGGEAATPAEPMASGAAAVALSLPGQQSVADWPQVNGNAAHLAVNAAYSGALKPVWRANVGRGSSRKDRITAAPVVAGGRVYTLDASDTIAATSTGGGTLWRTDLTPAGEHSGEGSGGGIAFGEGSVFATTGFGELIALDPSNGGIRWRQKFDVAVGGAPTVAGGTVYVVARDGTGWAVEAKDGKVVYSQGGAGAASGVTGGSSPAVSGDTVIFPFASGDLMAVKISDGTPIWHGFVAGKRAGRAYAAFSDLTGAPVIAGNTVYAGSSAGRLTALDLTTGAAIWAARDGALNPPVLAGGALFLVNDEDQLLRVDAGSGEVVWRIDMPYFEKDKVEKKRKTIFNHYGPVLAGGRIITASSDGLIRAFDPLSGRLLGTAEIAGGAAAPPVVAGGTLYVLSQSGQLNAYR